LENKKIKKIKKTKQKNQKIKIAEELKKGCSND